MLTMYATLTGPVTNDLAGQGIHLVVSANTKTSGDAWCDATDVVRAAGHPSRVALIHLHDGRWSGGTARYRDYRFGWVDATTLKVSFGVDDVAAAAAILAVLNRNGITASWDGNPDSCVHIDVNASKVKKTPRRETTADRLRSSYQYAETHMTHSHDVMLAAAAELDQLTAERDGLLQSLNDLEGGVVGDAARRADDLEAARAEGTRNALHEMHKALREVMHADGGTSFGDFAQAVDGYFVDKGLGTILFE